MCGAELLPWIYAELLGETAAHPLIEGHRIVAAARAAKARIKWACRFSSKGMGVATCSTRVVTWSRRRHRHAQSSASSAMITRARAVSASRRADRDQLRCPPSVAAPRSAGPGRTPRSRDTTPAPQHDLGRGPGRVTRRQVAVHDRRVERIPHARPGDQDPGTRAGRPARTSGGPGLPACEAGSGRSGVRPPATGTPPGRESPPRCPAPRPRQ